MILSLTNSEDEHYPDDDTAVAELKDAWRSFRSRWEFCFKEFVGGCPGIKVRKTVRKIAADGIAYLKKKEFCYIKLSEAGYRISKRSFDDWLDSQAG